MNFFSTQPIEEKTREELRAIIVGKEIAVSPHAYDHLSERQRKVFIDADLISMLVRENPRKAYLQKNGRYSAYYRRKDGYRKLIFEIMDQKVTIFTFVDAYEIPRYDLK